MDFTRLLYGLENVFGITSGVLATIVPLLGAYWSYKVSKRAKDNPADIQGSISPEDISRFENASSPRQPFETTALANYYNQALSRTTISFWFSIIFASIGFGVIIFAFLSYSPGDVGGTTVKVLGGTIIDAVSGLFFVQSTNAQKSMSDFF